MHDDLTSIDIRQQKTNKRCLMTSLPLTLGNKRLIIRGARWLQFHHWLHRAIDQGCYTWPCVLCSWWKSPQNNSLKIVGEKKGHPKKCLVFSSGGKVTNLTIEFSWQLWWHPGWMYTNNPTIILMWPLSSFT